MKRDPSSLLLLDVNVLIALAWPNHQFHRVATSRLESGRDRWATCALTKLGFIRLSSNPAVVSDPPSPAVAASLLKAMIRDSQHVYLDSLPSPVEKDLFTKILGNKQVTNVYLLDLARRHVATFVTFDARLKHWAAHAAAPGAKLELLGA
jgi:toxin-antitoxin system PIN domain toxin